MCGIYKLGDKFIEIHCEIIDPFWWKHPDPVIDFTRLVFDRPIEGPHPEPWRGELTEISRIITTAAYFENSQLRDQLGSVAAEIGNAIAERAGIDVRLEWSSHDG